mmetsp:Transcript_12003/g.21271  ORF Transcript_12003/g.21271 Transcript_12003/m.21271 type:complete len:1110 (+) Transcript_12003:84-3413(+)|eukprot:CAMPEP_0197660542 /NCGR_PEP_ID=MMETSP1338-20131121/50906_1 /TAXON_ID=43686 ORGANISM="Pelagodinium beii, Strain RCC1491" /NCGR_SAMPLE_ID=MMETSP1338 /ASSEMBLY_ACC=CAM_ASM_000754 /LENGTH=1109 /DNA_ID=CAMNT_0043237911 /DNA_START=82 /DNA_END=3411 /DNA_ORIENTATION=-
MELQAAHIRMQLKLIVCVLSLAYSYERTDHEAQIAIDATAEPSTGMTAHSSITGSGADHVFQYARGGGRISIAVPAAAPPATEASAVAAKQITPGAEPAKENSSAPKVSAVSLSKVEQAAGTQGTSATKKQSSPSSVVRGQAAPAQPPAPPPAGNTSTAPKPSGTAKLECGQVRAAQDIGGDDRCPAECPLFAEDTASGSPCNFKCVVAFDCGRNSSHTNLDQGIPDASTGFCRGCNIPGCKRCRDHVSECVACKEDLGWQLKDGTCEPQGSLLRVLVLTLVGIFVIYFFAWWFSILWRGNLNPEGERLGLEFRTSTKLSSSSIVAEAAADDPLLTADTEHKLYPLSTNVLNAPVGGCGSVLFFRFHIFIVVLSTLTMISHLIATNAVDPALLILGVDRFIAGKTFSASWLMDRFMQNLERDQNWLQRCHSVHAGHQLQIDTMPTRIDYLGGLYACSFLLVLAFAIYQKRTFEQLDDATTMGDYAAVIKGLPEVSGSEKLEEELKEQLKTQTGTEIVGVSVAWKYGASGEAGERTIEELEKDLAAKETYPDTSAVTAEKEDAAVETGAATSGQKKEGEEASASATTATAAVSATTAEGEAKPDYSRSTFWKLMDGFLIETVLGIPLNDSKPEPDPEKAPEKLATTCTSSHMAIVVFNTEEDRDKAVEKGNLTFREMPIQLENREIEPLGIMWNNMEIPRQDLTIRTLQSTLFIVAVILLWALVVYVPYAYYESSFSYINGDEPSGAVARIMSVSVSMANLIIYFVCFMAAERIGYAFEDEVQGVYLVMYIVAIVANIALDVGVSTWTAYSIAIGKNSRTYQGVLIQDLSKWNEILSTYELQKEIGDQVFEYGWYGTYFLPFICEWLGLAWFMLHIARRWVRASPYLKGMAAEKALQLFAPMDSARYGDLIVNLICAELIWFVPSGYALPSFLFLIFSHVFIFYMDKYRVLRWVPAFSISSDEVDWFANTLLMVPIGIIPAAMVFKRNCMNGQNDSFCHGDWSLAQLMALVFAGHCIIHYLAMKYVVPMFGSGKHKKTDMPYEKCAGGIAPSFFNTNAMHCLRSKYVYKHDPPCMFYMKGKQHLLEQNKEANCYFTDSRRFAKEKYPGWI